MRPLLAACILITFANTYRWVGRQIAYLGGANRRAIMRRLITQIFLLLAAPLSIVLVRAAPLSSMGHKPPSNLFAGEETSARVQISLRANDLALPARRTRGAPFPRGDILRTFCTYVRGAARRGRHAHVLQCSLRCSPGFSDALRRSSARSPPTDR